MGLAVTEHEREVGRDRPVVSAVVPCRNEKDHIEECVRSILAQEPPPGGFELIVADGMSRDGTREILNRLAAEDPRLRIADNPAQITPCGMNVGIRAAKGRYIAIMGAHTQYATNYLRRCVEILEEHPEVCCSGGPIISQGKSAFGRAVAVAMSHPMGVGNAKHRFPDYEGYAEGACFPVFRREVFEQVGLYDENLIRNQDDDLNYRVARQGGKTFISPRARCIYYVRETIRQLFKKYFQYGYWRVAVVRKHLLPASLRQLAPVLFFSTMLGMCLASIFLPGSWRLSGMLLPAAYAIVLAIAGLEVAARQGLKTGLLFPAAAAVMHAAYAAGFARAAINVARQRLTSVPRRKGAFQA
jgi:succinoglycan biosynthesis protein ExoA